MTSSRPLLYATLAWATASCSLEMSRYSAGHRQDSVECREPLEGPAQLSIDVSQKHQTLVGFGAAIAYYADWLTSFPSDSPINDAAFRDLGLDILRLRNKFDRQDFRASSDITTEVTVLERATQSLGRVPKILLSSWSPPANLKASGMELCSGTDQAAKLGCTLAKAAGGFVYDPFAQHFVQSLDYYAASGIVPDYLSIQNEPNYFPNGWEGCFFLPTEDSNYPGYDQALSTVRAALTAVSNPPKLLGPEVNNLSNGALDTYVAAATRSQYDVLAHHLYSGSNWSMPDSYLTQMADASATAADLPLFQTEFDTQGDGGTGGGFETAWVMHNALAVEGVQAFLYWSLFWAGPSTQAPSNAMIWISEGNYTLRDQYYAMRHFARYTDPGYTRIDVTSSQSDVRASAYLAPDSSQLTLVMLNVGSCDAQVTADSIAGFSATHTEAYQSTFNAIDAGPSERFRQLDDFDINQPFTLPSRSVLTVVLSAGDADAG
jgi:glucuronoarabinoxylan endo-1,4-beta-xylanase